MTTTTPTTPNGLAILIEALWAGELSQNDFTAQASQLGASVRRIEWEIEQVRQADEVAS